MPNNSDDLHSCSDNPIVENADIFVGLESLDEGLLPAKTTVLDNLGPLSEEPNVHASGSPNAEHDRLVIPLRQDVDDSASISKFDIAAQPDTSASQDQNLTDQKLDAEAFPCLENLDTSEEFTSSSGQQTGKFQPSLKRQANRLRNDTDTHDQDVDEPINSERNIASIPPKVEVLNQRSGPAFTKDNVTDNSSVGLCESAPSQCTSEVRVESVDGASTDFRGSFHEEGSIPEGNLDAGHELPGKLKSPWANAEKGEVHAASEHSAQPQASEYNETTVACEVLRERKRPINAYNLENESEDEGLENADLPSEPVVDMAHEELQIDDKPKKRKMWNKSKKLEAEKEKPVRKRRKKNTESTEVAKPAPKRFSRSTQRRKVDKALLETPYEEIDMRDVILKNVIRLGEHYDRVEKMEAKSSKEQQSTVNHTVAGDEDGPSAEGSDNEESYMGEDICINYHTFMRKTPRSRWSKQDTEVFFQALRLFYTDFTSIQQCFFRDKTHKQIVLKFNKECRQNPLRVHEALSNPSKDLSRLNQFAAEIQENCRADVDEDEGAKAESEEIGEEAIMPEEMEMEIDEAVVDRDMKPDVAETQGPAVDSEDREDDLSLWSQYKSDL